MQKKVKRTKIGDIEKHLRRYGSITDPVARKKYHTNRLSDFIFKLRQRGYVIETVMCTGKDEYGTYEFAKYVLVSAPIKCA